VRALLFIARFFLPPLPPFLPLRPLTGRGADDEVTRDARGCSSSSSSLSSASLRDDDVDSRRLFAARGEEGDGSLRIDEAGDSALLGWDRVSE
jgi:hypothetical protein